MALNIYYQNVRGLRTKTLDLKLNSSAFGYDIYCLTETWLNANILDSEIFDLNMYTVYRRDRNYLSCGTTLGGGSLIAISNKFSSCRKYAYESNVDFLEDIWVKIKINNSSHLHICVLYISPNKALNVYSKHFDCVRDYISSIDQNDNVIIVGDYNIPEITWTRTQHSFLLPITCSLISDELLNMISFTQLHQFNSTFNILGGLLDLVLCDTTTNSLRVTSATQPLLPIDHFHPPLEMIYTLRIENIKTRRDVVCNFKRANYDQIRTAFDTVDWNILTPMDCEHAVGYFYNFLSDLISRFVPKKRRSKYYPDWYSGVLINLIKEKAKFKKKYRIYHQNEHYNRFSRIRANIKVEMERCHQDYIRKIQESIQTDIRKFWSYSRSFKKSSSVPQSVFFNQATSQSPTSVCQLFADFFKSVYPTVNYISQLNSRNDIEVNNLLVIREANVLEAIKYCSVNKGPGTDEVPMSFIREISTNITPPLTRLFNKSLSSGIFPAVWKRSIITPIFKKGNRCDVTNYRPISILNSFSKIFEKIVRDIVFDIVKPILNPRQHGFIKKRSTTTNLIEYTEYISRSLNAGKEVHAIYTDFSKAFDTVDFSILIQKLELYGIHGTLLRWLESYLINRSLYVAIDGWKSGCFSPTSGVPQGSILGPLLFIIFINDLVRDLSCEYLLYADDLKIFRVVNNVNDCLYIQNDLGILDNWCTQNKLYLNIEKCFFLRFSLKINKIDFMYTLGSKSLNIVNQAKDLGVIFDSKLSFGLHIKNIVNKAYRALGFICRITKQFTNEKCFVTLYVSLVRSHLEYASQIWNPFNITYIDNIEKVQRKFTRFLNFKMGRPSATYEERLSHFHLMKLNTRRMYLDMTLMYKFLHDMVECNVFQYFSFNDNFNAVYNIRRTYTFNLITPRIDVLKYAPLNRMQSNFNNNFNHLDVMNINFFAFKSSVLGVLSL